MSQYTNQSAILGEIQESDLIALTDDSGLGVVNTSVLTKIIENASGFIDSKLANIYGSQIPFIPVPSSVASMALSIVCHRLLRRREVPDEKNKFTEDYRDVVDFLNRVNRGEAMIDDVVARDFSQVAYTSRSTTFGVKSSNFPANSL